MRDVLASKITIPLLDDNVVERVKLSDKLEKLPHYSLAIMTAGAGYGKTTTLVQYLAQQELPVGWYNLGPEDDNLYFFSIYLSASLDRLFPGLKEWYCARIAHEENIDWKILFFNLMMGLEEFQSQSAEGFLVIDDFQYVRKDPDIRMFFGRFLATLPAQLHVIILSREYIDIGEVENLRMKGNVLDFLPTDFLFNLEEIETFLKLMQVSSVTEEEAAHILDQTEGWAIIVKLLANQWQEGAGHFLQNFNNEELAVNRVFEYLSHAIFNSQTEEIQDFLMRTALVEIFDLAYCKEIVSSNKAARLLTEVIKTGLFISRIGENVYRYHSLFKEFLRLQAKRSFPDMAVIYKQIATFYQKQHNTELALQFFARGGEWPAAADILAEAGRHWVNSGRQKLFQEYVDQLPNKYRQDPRLYLALGDQERFTSEYGKAVTWYKLAEKEFRKRRDAMGQSQSCHGLGEVYLDIIQPDQAQEYLRRAYKLLPEGHEEEKGNLLYLMSENMINHGDSRRAERYWRLWLEVVPFNTVDKNNLRARILLRTGRIDEVISLLEPKYKEEHLLRTPVSFRESSLILALCYTYKGDAEKAIAYAQSSIVFAHKIQAAFTEAVGYERTGHALLLDYRHTREICRQSYDKAADMVEKLGVARGKTEILQGHCLMEALEGHWQEAERAGLEGISITETTHDAWFIAELYLTLAMAANICHQYDEGEQYGRKGLQLFGACRDFLGQAACYWQLTYLYYQLKRSADFEQAYTSLLALCETHHCGFLLQGKSLLGDLTGFTSKPFAQYHKRLSRNQAAVEEVAKTLPDLYIKTLGGFKLMRQGQEVPGKEWRRKAAKQLLFLLVTLRTTPVARESLMTYLWPDSPEKDAITNFKVVLNQLTNILEPDRKPRAASKFITRQDVALQLANRDECLIDVNAFETCIAKGTKLAESHPAEAVSVLCTGLSLYEGEYLAGEYLDDASLRERDRLQMMALKGAEKLAVLYLADKDYENAVLWANRILQMDNCWEQAYQVKLVCYGEEHDKALLERVYRRCEETLKNELGVEPSAKTKELYKKYK